jgi:hypothetical protein
VQPTAEAIPTIRLTRWIWALPVLVSAVLAALAAGSLLSWVISWLCDIPRAIASSASILLLAGFGYLLWMVQLIEM